MYSTKHCKNVVRKLVEWSFKLFADDEILDLLKLKEKAEGYDKTIKCGSNC